MATRTHQTIVRNISGSDMYFSWVSEHGSTISSGAYLAIAGDVRERLRDDPIQRAAMKYAVDNHLIEFVQTPELYVYDTVTYKPYRLGSTSGSPVVRDPDYGSYTGSNTSPSPPNNP